MLIQRMFDPILSRIPRNRLDLVNDLDILDITLDPYIWVPPEDYLEPTYSWLDDIDDLRLRSRSVFTESDLALSRAMTDSEIDYERYKRIKYRRLSDPFAEMREAINYFPSRYIDSLNSFQSVTPDWTLDNFVERRLYNEDLLRYNEAHRRYMDKLRLRMARYYDDFQLFTPDDPGAQVLEEALRNLDYRRIQLDLVRMGL